MNESEPWRSFSYLNIEKTKLYIQNTQYAEYEIENAIAINCSCKFKRITKLLE